MPSLPPLYARAALGGAIGSLPASGLIGRLPLIPGGGRGDELPATGLAVDGVVADIDALAGYCRVCGFTMGDALPVTFPHVLAFPLQMMLMTDDAFPFPLLGLVHIDNSITQHRPIGTGEPIDLAVRAEDLRPHPKGTAISLIVESQGRGRRRGARLGGDGDDPAPRPGAGLHRRPERARAGGRRRAGDIAVAARRRPRAAIRGGFGRSQPDPPASAQRSGPRLSPRHRARDVEQGTLPRSARGRTASRLHGRGQVPEADPAAGNGRIRRRRSRRRAGLLRRSRLPAGPGRRARWDHGPPAGWDRPRRLSPPSSPCRGPKLARKYRVRALRGR